MASSAPLYIWQQPDWPALHYDAEAAGPALAQARELKGEVGGLARAIGLDGLVEVEEALWTQEAVATAAIEGERLDLAAVRSSVLRRLGTSDTGPVDRHVDGLVQVIHDATTNFDEPLDTDRLCRWQSALFPGGTTGIRRIAVGRYRDHADAMQIVSGLPGREVVHYTAPPSSSVPREMEAFLAWFAQSRHGTMDGIARAAISHLWFETIHPFEDGNGRVGRAVADMALAQDSRASTRLFSLSRQLLADRKGYYDALASGQSAGMDATAFVQWFAQAFGRACVASADTIQSSLERSRFWTRHAQHDINERQRQLLRRLLEAGDGGFLGGLNVEKYLKMVRVSKATATRDLSDLVRNSMLYAVGQGKAVRYYVNMPGWTHGVAVANDGREDTAP